jgi:hypothetical protein
MIPTVKDNPYVCEFECRYNRATHAGEKFSSQATGVIARDSSGRRVQAFNYNPFGSLAPFRIAIILDPATEMFHVVDRESSATLVSSPARTDLLAVPAPVVGAGFASPVLFYGSAAGDTFLGRQVIEGMRCRGYRRLGRARLEIEFWVADELQDTVLARLTSGGFESTFRTHSVRRGEPDLELLTIPPPDEGGRIFDFHFAPL